MTYITDIEQIGIEQGIEQGIEKGQEKLIRNMFRNGMTVEEIAKVTGLEKAKVQSLVSKEQD